MIFVKIELLLFKGNIFFATHCIFKKCISLIQIASYCDNIFRTNIAEKEKSPPRPPSILKKRPMAALRSDSKAQKPEKPHLEYRIIVSNLRSTVTGGDIEVGRFV